MENNVFEQMGAQGEVSPASKSAAAGNESAASQVDRSAETTLNQIATIVLVVGIIAVFVCLFTICFVKKHGDWGDNVFNPAGFAMTAGVLFTSVTTWAVLRVLANISNTLKDLNCKK